MDAFFSKDSRRATGSEVISCIEDKIDSTLVRGFSNIADVGDSFAGGQRYSGYNISYDMHEWHLPLSGNKAMSWKTCCVPEKTRSLSE